MNYNELNKAIDAGKKIVDLEKRRGRDFYYAHIDTTYTNIYELRYNDELLSLKDLDKILNEYGIADNTVSKKKAVYILVTTYYLVLLLNYIKNKKDLIFLSDELDYLVFNVKPRSNINASLESISNLTNGNYILRHNESMEIRRKWRSFNRLFLFFSNYIINNVYSINIPINNTNRSWLPKINISDKEIKYLDTTRYGKIWLQLYSLINSYKSFNKEKINICIYCNNVFNYDKRKTSWCNSCSENGNKTRYDRKLDRESLKVKTNYIINYKDKYYNLLSNKEKKEIDKIIAHPSEARDNAKKYKLHHYYSLCNEIMLELAPPTGMKIRPTE